jgi:hypothetical protein
MSPTASGAESGAESGTVDEVRVARERYEALVANATQVVDRKRRSGVWGPESIDRFSNSIGLETPEETPWPTKMRLDRPYVTVRIRVRPFESRESERTYKAQLYERLSLWYGDVVIEPDSEPEPIVETAEYWSEREHQMRKAVIDTVCYNENTRSNEWCPDGKAEVIGITLINSDWNEIEQGIRRVILRLVDEYPQIGSNNTAPEMDEIQETPWRWLFFTSQSETPIEIHCDDCTCWSSNRCHDDDECECRSCGCNPRYISGRVSLYFDVNGLEVENDDEEATLLEYIESNYRQAFLDCDDSNTSWEYDD